MEGTVAEVVLSMPVQSETINEMAQAMKLNSPIRLKVMQLALPREVKKMKPTL